LPNLNQGLQFLPVKSSVAFAKMVLSTCIGRMIQYFITGMDKEFAKLNKVYCRQIEIGLEVHYMHGIMIRLQPFIHVRASSSGDYSKTSFLAVAKSELLKS